MNKFNPQKLLSYYTQDCHNKSDPVFNPNKDSYYVRHMKELSFYGSWDPAHLHTELHFNQEVDGGL